MADQYGLLPLPLGVPFDPAEPEQPFQPADIFGGFIAGWEEGGAAQTLTASLFTNSNAFYAPTVTPGAVTLTPGLYSNANAFYAPTVSAGAVTLTPARYDNAQAFYAPTVSAGSTTLAVSLYSNANAFYSATVSPGAVTLTPALFTNSNSFYAPTVSAGAVTLSPARYDNANAFYAVTIVQEGGNQTLLPSLYVNAQTFYEPVVSVADSYLRGEGWIPQIKRNRKFSEERDEREQLRTAIEQAVDPVTDKEAKVVTVKGEVAVVTKSLAIPIPVPPQFDAQAVARMVVTVLEAQGVEAQRVRDAENRRRALLALEAKRVENARRFRKRRRDEEILLMM